MEFFKTTSFGNDFIVINQEELDKQKVNDFVKNICDRDNSVGGDGVVSYYMGKNFVDFRIFNADGSEAELSGNGMAAVSSVLFYKDLFENRIVLNTKSGVKEIKLIDNKKNSFNLYIEIGEPNFSDLKFFPFLNKKELKIEDINFHPVSVGNPHIVVFIDFEKRDWFEITDKIMQEFELPFGTNFEFVKIIDDDNVKVLFFERGVGITPFSSTGSSAVMSILNKLKNINHTFINMKKDKNKVEIRNKKIYLENKTKILYKGILF